MSDNKVLNLNDKSVKSSVFPFNESTTYEVDGKRFIVTPIFKSSRRETFGSVLLRLMQSEITGSAS